MVGNGDVNALIQGLVHVFLSHRDDFLAEDHVVHGDAGNQLLKAAGVFLRQLEHLLRSAARNPISSALLEYNSLSHDHNFLAIGIHRHKGVVVEYATYHIGSHGSSPLSGKEKTGTTNKTRCNRVLRGLACLTSYNPNIQLLGTV